MIDINRLRERPDEIRDALVRREADPAAVDRVLALDAPIAAQLSGHTHGGQIFPLGQIARWDQGQLDGVTQEDGLAVHVTPGTGYWGPAMRLLSRAEVSIIELYAAAGTSRESAAGR